MRLPGVAAPVGVDSACFLSFPSPALSPGDTCSHSALHVVLGRSQPGGCRCPVLGSVVGTRPAPRGLGAGSQVQGVGGSSQEGGGWGVSGIRRNI